MSEDISKRLSWFLETKNLTASKLADLVGIQKSSLSHIISGRNKPSFDFLLKLKQAFPEIDLDWFVTGKGNAFENKKEKVDKSLSTKRKEKTLFDPPEIEETEDSLIKNPVHKSKQDGVNSIVFIYSDDTYKMLKPRK